MDIEISDISYIHHGIARGKSDKQKGRYNKYMTCNELYFK